MSDVKLFEGPDLGGVVTLGDPLLLLTATEDREPLLNVSPAEDVEELLRYSFELHDKFGVVCL